MWWNRKHARVPGLRVSKPTIPRLRVSKPTINDELQFHRDRLAEELVAKGIDANEARRRAVLEFGNVTAIADDVRDVRGHWLDDLWRDLRYAIRMMRRAPGFTLAIVLSLALGIGANTAIFSVINAVMLRALPVPEPARLVRVGRLMQNGGTGLLPYPIFAYLRDNVTAASGMFAMTLANPSVIIDGADELVMAEAVSGDYFRVLGLEPATGRLLGTDDDRPGALPAAVISDGYWLRRFSRSPSAVGTTVTVRNRAFTIVGVAPAGFRSAQAGRSSDLILPLSAMLSDEQRRSIGFNSLSVLARLRPDATVDQAAAEIQTHFTTFLQTNSVGMPENRRAEVLRQRAVAFSAPGGFNPMRDAVATPLMILMSAAGLVLLLVCVNLSGLLLARAAARRREIAIRLAIGASRGRLVRQFLTESLLMASIGGAAGLLVAGPFSTWLLTIFVSGRDLSFVLSPDARVLAFTAGVSLLACVLAGLVPALQSGSVRVNTALKQVRASGGTRLGNVLVIAQIAISMVLLVGATLFVGTLVNLYRENRGFNSDGLLVLNVRHPAPYAADRAAAVQTSLRDRLATLPGVLSASATQALPIGGGLWDRTVQVEGYTFAPNESNSVGFSVIAPQYFSTLGTPLQQGREFDARDTSASPFVTVVNDSFARKFFPNGSALGRHVTSVGVTYEIVGIVGDAKYQDLRSAMMSTIYIPWTQRQGDQPSNYAFLVRIAGGDPRRIAPELDRLVRDVDPALRVRTATTYGDVIDRSIVTERVLATLAGLFGLLALTVAALGMFGLLAFQVARRTNELGVRMVLGATRWSMMRLVLKGLLGMLVPGLLIGVVMASFLAGLTSKLVFGLTSTDPGVFAVAAATLAVAVLLAGWLPARRAARVDPIIALRQD